MFNYSFNHLYCIYEKKTRCATFVLYLQHINLSSFKSKPPQDSSSSSRQLYTCHETVVGCENLFPWLASTHWYRALKNHNHSLGLNHCLDLTKHQFDIHCPFSKMSFSILILSGANLENVTHCVLKINCLQLRIQRARGGNWCVCVWGGQVAKSLQ